MLPRKMGCKTSAELASSNLQARNQRSDVAGWHSGHLAGGSHRSPGLCSYTPGCHAVRLGWVTSALAARKAEICKLYDFEGFGDGTGCDLATLVEELFGHRRNPESCFLSNLSNLAASVSSCQACFREKCAVKAWLCSVQGKFTHTGPVLTMN